MDLDAAPLEPFRRVRAEAARDLREDLRRRVDEHPPLRHVAKRRVEAQRRVCHVVQLAESLDARVSGADEDEPELRRIVGMDGRALELQEHAIPERDRVREVLEADAVLRQPGYREGARRRSERHHEALVVDLQGAGERLERDGLGAPVDAR